MLNYEQCKSLKDAGFPQGISAASGNTHFEIDCASEILVHGISQPEPIRSGQYLKIPTLSELIAACGGYLVLEKGQNEWNAYWDEKPFQRPVGFHAIDLFMITNTGKGATPEEAVCNLWLALNKKNA